MPDTHECSLVNVTILHLSFLALGIIFYRFHNLLAAKIQQQRPDWEDEDVFQAARRRVIATLQVLKVRKIVS